MAAINERTKWIKDQLSRWNTARDVIAGTYAVRAKGEVYLPKAYAGQEVADYLGYQKHVPFYPAANRTCDGIVGLMMRRDPVLEADGLLAQIKNVISSDGDSVEELARKACREVLTTNYCGLFTDYPSEKASSLGAMLTEGKRPFVNLYKAESILECTPGIVRGRKLPKRVRLLEDHDSVLLLEIGPDGFVVCKRYRAENEVFPPEEQPTETYALEANGSRLTEIPFDLITTGDSFEPSEAPLDSVVALNLDHFVQQSMLSKQLLFNISPMLFVTGVDESGGDEIKWMPAAIYTLPNPDSKIFVASVPSDAAVPIEHQMASLEDKMATVASRMLARQKPVAEAAETEAVRQGAENSVLAMIANAVSDKMAKAFARVALYQGQASDVRFQINTDYLVVNRSPQELTALLALRQAGEISEESLFYNLREGSVYDDTLTYEQERQRRAAVPPQTNTAPVVTEVQPNPLPDAAG